MCDQRHDVRIESGFGQDLARDLHADRERKDRVGMRLDYNRIAGGEARKKPGVTIPCGKRAAADDQRNTPWHDTKPLFHLERLVLSLRLLPLRACGDATHFVPSVRHRFKSAILRMRSARLKRHQECLARRMHDGIGDQETFLVDPR